MTVFVELKRRNGIYVERFYLVWAWLLVQPMLNNGDV